MAKKKAARSTAQGSPILSRLQGNLKKLQRNAEGVLSRVRKEATHFSRDQKRSLDRVVTEAQRLRSDFEKAATRTSKDLESRSKRLLSTLEKQVEKRLDPVIKRLAGGEPASRQELQTLSKRVQDLEQLVKQHAHPEPAAPAKQPSLFPSEVPPPSTDE